MNNHILLIYQYINWKDDSLHDTNGKFEDFVESLEKCVDRHAPLTKVNRKQMNKSLKPWINKTILRSSFS